MIYEGGNNLASKVQKGNGKMEKNIEQPIRRWYGKKGRTQRGRVTRRYARVLSCLHGVADKG